MEKYRNKELENFLEKADELGWLYIFNKEESGRTYVDIGIYSPLGEDFNMTVNFSEENPIDTFMSNLKEYYLNFDPEDHAAMWIKDLGKNGTPDSIRDLIDDANTIKKMIGGLIHYLEATV